jgi:hypothetical protein
MDKTDIQFITEGLEWLSKNINSRDDTDGGANPRAVTYSNTQMRVLHRIKDFSQISEENMTILLRAFLTLKLQPDVLDIAVLASTVDLDGKPRPMEWFNREIQLLLSKLVFRAGATWSK